MTAESCILADQLTLSLPGGRLCPKHFCPPSKFFFKTSSIPVLYFCSFRYKDPRILPILIKASIAHLVERLTPDLKVPGSIPGGGSFFFFYKSKDNKITSCFSVGLYFISYNPTEKWLQYHRIVLRDSKGLGNPSIPSSSSRTQETSGMVMMGYMSAKKK